MCVVENSGRFGGTYAAPIVGMMIEKYLKDSITEKPRRDKVEQLSKLNLIPSRIYSEIRRQDSIRHSKDYAYLLSKGYIKFVKDTLGMEDDELDKDELAKFKKEKPKEEKKSTKDTVDKAPAILPKEKKGNPKKDSTR
jgi:penicillin-binding protein 2